MFLEGVEQKLEHSSITKINPFSRRSSYVLHSFILTTFVLLVASSVGAVDRSDLCINSPVDQCSNNQLVELGNVDGDTSGKDYLFNSNIDNIGESGQLVLQYKDSASISFSQESVESVSSRVGGSTDFFNNFATVNTQDEGSTQTITVNGNEHDITVDSVDLGSDSFQVTIDGGVNSYSGGIGDQVNDLFGEGEDVQFLDGSQTTEDNLIADPSDGECQFGEHTGNVYEICLQATYDGSPNYADIEVNGTLYQSVDEDTTFTHDNREFLVDLVGADPDPNVVTVDEYIDVESLDYGFAGEITSPEGYNEYRLKWEGDSGSTAFSNSLFFSVDRGDNLPYDREVTVEDSVVRNPELTSGVTPGSGINLNVFQEEDDPVNVSLVNAANDNTVATISGNRTSQGAFYTIYNDVKTTTLASFLDTSSEDVFTFPAAGDLMDSQGTQYEFYFEIKERDATQDTRTTKTYTVETDGSATNPAPVIHSVEAYNGDSWVPVQDIGYNELYKIRANVTDSNNEFLNVDLTYNNDYDGSSELEGLSDTSSEVSFSKRDSGYYVWEGDRLENNTDSGSYSLEVNASDGSTSTVESRSWSYPFGEPEVSLSVTDSVVEDNFFYPEITVSCPEYECVNQNESISVYLDPVEVLL